VYKHPYTIGSSAAALTRKGQSNMKKLFLVAVLAAAGLQGCVLVPDGRRGGYDGSYHCPPGQAKKGNC
jgi:hypothetical protein